MLKSAELTVCAQQECDCIPGIAPQSPAASLQHPRSAAVMSSLGTRHAITGVASNTASAANNPSFLPARITKVSVGSFSGQHKGAEQPVAGKPAGLGCSFGLSKAA
jgi:hypothetical protein